MYVSRLAFHTLPGKTHEVEEELKQLVDLVAKAGGTRPRVLRTHFASLGSPDVVFEQEASDLPALETQIRMVTESADFQQWTRRMSGLLAESPKRELYLIAN